MKYSKDYRHLNLWDTNDPWVWKVTWSNNTGITDMKKDGGFLDKILF